MTAWRAYLVPAGVFQSLMIGGGYGTGREVVEYFSRFGFLGGLLGTERGSHLKLCTLQCLHWYWPS